MKTNLKARKPNRSATQATKNYGKVTWFSIACVAITLGYVGYRFVTLAGPNNLKLFGTGHAEIVTIGCNENQTDEANASDNKLRIGNSASYQDYIRQLPASGPNLVKNPLLSQIDSSSGSPVGFFRTVENAQLAYSIEHEANLPYLRVSQAPGEQLIGSAWVATVVSTEDSKTYAYSFAYRATTEATVTLEYTVNGRSNYETIAKLRPTKDWQPFAAHFYNTYGATALRFIISPDGAGTVDSRMYDIHAVQSAALNRGLVTIAFDDGWQSIADHAAPLMKKYGVHSTQYVISDATTKNVPEYMGLKTVRKLKAAGHEIASHTLSHCDMTKASAQTLQDNATLSKQTLEEEGLGPITSFAYPYGKYDQRSRQAFEKTYAYVRTSDEGFNDRHFDTKNIRSYAVLHTTSDATFRYWLEYAKTHKVWVVIVYHRIAEHGNYSVTTAQFERQLKMITESKLPVLTLGEAAPSIR